MRKDCYQGQRQIDAELVRDLLELYVRSPRKIDKAGEVFSTSAWPENLTCM